MLMAKNLDFNYKVTARVDDTGGVEKYKHVQDKNWNETEKLSGKTINQERFSTRQKSENILGYCFC